MSIIDLLSCGFAKVCCYIFTKIKDSSRESMGNLKYNQSQVLKEWYQLFLEQFPGAIHVTVKSTRFSNTFKKLVPHIQYLRKKHPNKKNLLFDFFY